MKKCYYVEKSKVNEALQTITQAQEKANVFCNVSVSPYNGQKYEKETTVVVTVG